MGRYSNKKRQYEKNEKKIDKHNETRNIRKTIDLKKYKEAQTMIDEALNENSGNIYVLYEQGRLYIGTKEYSKAKELFKYLVDIDAPNKYFALYELGKIEARENNLSTAESYFKDIINSNHQDKSHAKLELAKVKRREAIYVEAELILKDLIRNDASNRIFAELQLAEVYLMTNRITETDLLLSSLKYDKNNIKIQNYVTLLKGRVDIERKNIPAAKEKFNEIVKTRASQSKKALTQLAIIAYGEQDIEEFKKLSSKILEIKDGNDTEIKILLNKIYQACSQVDEARSLLKANLNNRNKDSISLTYLNLGILETFQHDIVLAKKYFNESLKVSDKAKKESLAELLFIDIKEENYDDAYMKINELINLASSEEDKENFQLLKLQLDLMTKNEEGYKDYILTYRMEQLLNYSKERAIEHIKEHKREKSDKASHGVFSEDIVVEELYDWAQSYLTEENYIRTCELDIYVLDYPNVGTFCGRKENYLKVITNPNTKDIITMYPYDKKRMYLPDIIEEIPQKELLKQTEKDKVLTKEIKRESQIEKFNKRYGINK